MRQCCLRRIVCRRFISLIRDFLAEDLLMHAHGFVVAAGSSVEFGEKDGHLNSGWVKRTPHAAEVVANVFAEVNGAVPVLVGEADLNESTANPDDSG